MTLLWNESAKEEAKDIYGYLFDYSPALADDWSDELAKKLGQIASFPESGRIVPDFQISFIREVFIRKYRLIYLYQDDTIRILALRPMGSPLGRI